MLVDIAWDSGCLNSAFRVTELYTLQERMEKLLRISDLLLMNLLSDLLDMWADPEHIEVFISYSWTDVVVSGPCSNILVTAG